MKIDEALKYFQDRFSQIIEIQTLLINLCEENFEQTKNCIFQKKN